MSKTIDERVVEMRFDNKQFEQETKRTMGTLAKLKEALKIPGAEKALVGVDKAARNIQLDGIAEGVKLLSDRFSAMGIVGMQVIENITNALTNKLARAVNFVSDAIVSGGIRRAMNIENAHFQLQALLKDEAKVQAVMDNAMESVDGTAYAYDEAAKAASMFAASGLQAGEEMLQALKGITGVAAMTNSDFESMSMIFTTVAGNGRLMGDQLLQLSSRGLNAASTLADYFREVQGQAGMTESTIREMVTDGEISFKDFSNAMSWAFGDSAKRANETFTGAMSNMKSALARIGAEFISPLVEQNGEMVNLFNALRIKINDVKSALAFDVQASAISGLTKRTQLLVQTVADMTKEGTIGFDQITNAILGTGRSEEELSEINERLSATFDSVKESGFASNEVLTQIGHDGVDAYDALSKYMNGVTNGTIRATGELKRSVRELTNGTEISRTSIYNFAKEGKISFDMFNNAIVSYSGVVEKNSSVTSNALKAMFNTVKEAGSVSGDMLKDFQKNGISATSALIKYINGVNDGTIRASYATKKAIEEMTGGVKISGKEIQEFADQGVINFDMFKSAMETSFGDSKALTKQVTDFVLDHLKSLVEYVNQLDMTKPMELFYYGIEIVKNGLKGLGSVIRPVTKAASQVFSGFSIDDMIKIASRLEELSAKLQLSETKSENLRKAFKGVFDIVKVLIDIVKKFIKALNPSFEPVDQLGEGLFGLAGNLGECLSKFSDWISTSETVNKGIEKTAEFVKFAAEQFKNFGRWVKSGFDELRKSPVTKQVMESFGKGLEKVAKSGKDFIKAFGEGLAEIPKFISEIFGGDSTSGVDGMAEGLQGVQDVANGLDFEKPISTFERLKDAVSRLGEALMGNKGINVFVTNVNAFFDRMIDAFQAETLEQRIDMVTSALDKFINWIKKNLEPIFGDVSVGGVITAGSGIGMIYSIMKMAKSFESVANKIKAIPDLLGPIKSTLTAYQNDLKADQLVKIAKAISMLGITLTIMSFADWDQIWKAAIALAAVSGIVLWASSKFLGALNKAKDIPDVLNTLAEGFKSALKKMGRALEIKAIGSTVKDFGKTIVLIAGAIGSIMAMVKSDPNSFWQAVDVVTIIGSVIAGIAAVLLIISGLMPPSLSLKTAGVAGTILALAGSLYIVVGALKKLFKMEIPHDSGARLRLLGSVMQDMYQLFVSVSLTSFIFGGGGIKSITPLVGLIGSLYLAVLSLQKLFSITIPPDVNQRINMLMSVIKELAAIMAVMEIFTGGGFSGKDSGKTMLGFAAVLVAVAWSLTKLAEISGNKLARAVAAMDGVLVGLAITFSHMGGVGGEKDTGKSVLYMAVTIGAIAVALGVLSMIPLDLLAKAVVALDSVLLMLALDYVAISKIKTDKAANSILFLAITTVAITMELVILSAQPWEGLLAGATSLGIVLLALAGAFRIIGETTGDIGVGTFILMGALVAELLVIMVPLVVLSSQPWEGLLAAAASLSLVLMALTAAFKIIGECTGSVELGTFLLLGSLVAALLVIMIPIKVLAEEPWDGMLAAATALSEVLLAISAAALIVSKIKVNIKSGLEAIGFLDLFIIDLAAILTGFGLLKQELAKKGIDLDELMRSGTGTLALISNGIGEFIGNFIGGFAKGALSGLADIGTQLSLFMENASGFFDKIGSVDESATKGVKNMAEAILMITAADILEGMFGFITKGTSVAKFGQQLKSLGTPLKEFAEETAGIDGKQVEGAASALKIMAEAAKTLPKLGGIQALVFGQTKTLSDFAKELEDYGEAIVPFAEKVQGIDGNSVQGAADAASIMAEMAKTLPATDGLWQKIFGEKKSLSEFAKELEDFGPSLAQFALYVVGIRKEHVKGASEAAEILSTMAQNMPDTNSLWENWFGGGTQSITSFSSELKTFGSNMIEFANNVKDFNGTKIDEVTKSFKALVELANFIQEDETDSMYLTTFASNLSFVATDAVEAFCTAFEDSDQKAKDAVKGLVEAANEAVLEVAEGLKISSALLGSVMALAVANGIGEKESVITEKINELGLGMLVTLETATVASLFNNITQSSLSGIVTAVNIKKPTIQNAVRTLGQLMISSYNTSVPQMRFVTITQNAFQGVLNGINARKGAIINTVRFLGNEIINSLNSSMPGSSFSATGTRILQAFMTGFNQQRVLSLGGVEQFCEDLISRMSTSLPRTTFVEMGTKITSSLIAGINSQTQAVQQAVQNVMNAATQQMNDVQITQAAQQVGQNISSGVAKGMNSSAAKNKVDTAAKRNTEYIERKMKNLLEIKSPSRVMMRIGEYVSLGLAEGIANRANSAEQASGSLASKVLYNVSSLKDYMKSIMDVISDENFDASPTITPVVDASNVDREIANMNQQFKSLGDLKLQFNDAIQTSTLNAKEISGRIESAKLMKEQKNEELTGWAVKSLSDFFNQQKKEPSGIIQNSFNIQGENPEEIAYKVSRIITQQIERKEKTWA